MSRTLFSSLALVALLAGCDNATEPPRPSTEEAAVGTSGESVAEPSAMTTDAVPEASAVLPEASTGATGGQSDAPSQASPEELSKREESTQMPMPGQVNNHSVPQPQK